jgi:hypothetical protein
LRRNSGGAEACGEFTTALAPARENSQPALPFFIMSHATARKTVVISGLAAVMALLWLGGALANTWQGFEEPDVGWKVAETDAEAKLLVHERSLREAHGGHGSEHFRLALGVGNKYYLTYDVPPARAITELRLALWLKSDRVGPQLFARVVLPRTREPHSDRPLTMLIPGNSYGRAGAWEQLSITDVPTLVERHARILRTQFGPAVDTREAYVDKLVINAYSEPGVIQLWIDDLEVTGQVALSPNDGSGSGVRQAAFDTPAGAGPIIQLDGSMVMIQGTPQQLRMIEHNGESLEWLKSVGFNCVLLREPPNATLLGDAQRVGVWLIAPPAREQERIAITPAHAPVLAWMLGSKLGAPELENARAIARELRIADSASGRPLIASAAAPLSAYSRCANMLFLEPPPLGGSMEMADYAAWFDERPRLARPGTPLVALLPSEPPASVIQQFDALRPGTLLPHVLDYEQLRLLTFTAVASGARGIAFRSQTRLDGQGATAQQRADILRLINAELRLVEPWMAAGTHAGDTEVDDPQVRISALQTDRARLLVVRRYLPGQQWVPPTPEKDRVALVMPGTPSSTHAYRLSTLGMEPLVHKRVTGGLSLAVEGAGTCSLVVLTQDPLVLNRVARDLAALEAQQAQLHYDITNRRLDLTTQALPSLPGDAHPASFRAIEQASLNLQQALRLLAARDRRGAEKFVVLADAQLTIVQRGQWEAATKAFSSPIESPLCTSFATLPAHYELAERLRGATWSDNVLAGGDMERLDALVESGWRHQRDPNQTIESAVELAPQSHSGRSSLHLVTKVAKTEEAPSVVESPPVWVISPELTIGANKMVRIRGHVRTSAAIGGSRDGLMVFDSIGGQALAARIVSPDSWRAFTLYRAVSEDTKLTITLALTGLGEAWLDDLEISVLDMPEPRLSPVRGSTPSDGPPEEISAPKVRAEELPAPQARRGWWPRLR